MSCVPWLPSARGSGGEGAGVVVAAGPDADPGWVQLLYTMVYALPSLRPLPPLLALKHECGEVSATLCVGNL